MSLLCDISSQEAAGKHISLSVVQAAEKEMEQKYSSLLAEKLMCQWKQLFLTFRHMVARKKHSVKHVQWSSVGY